MDNKNQKVGNLKGREIQPYICRSLNLIQGWPELGEVHARIRDNSAIYWSVDIQTTHLHILVLLCLSNQSYRDACCTEWPRHPLGSSS